ncbi:MAG: GatB/YqeY domain-containing protein [Gemmatimonadota bacterium]|jgi:uncharacterized protein YqeY
MATLKERLREDLNAARRARDKLRTTLLTTTLAEVRNREIETRRDATDEDLLDVLGRAVRKRREAAEQIRAAGGQERAAGIEEAAQREEREAELLGAYLPPPFGEAEVRVLVRDAIAGGAADIGAVMRAVMPALKGRFDGREANRIAREELG